MPELPEVETCRRVMERVLLGRAIVESEFAPDSIVLKGSNSEELESWIRGNVVTEVGRKGKTWWLTFETGGSLVGHLGMAGWIREIGAETVRLREHGSAPLDDPTGRPKFLKMMLRADSNQQIVMTDGRRLARLWRTPNIESDPKITQLGPDAFLNLPSPTDLEAIFGKRKAPIKSLLMDQGLLSGVGNWLVDEILYQAGIAPQRSAGNIETAEWQVLHQKTESILTIAVEAGANHELFPTQWMFHVRWGGSKGAGTINGQPLERTVVGGRTTAWAPSVQK